VVLEFAMTKNKCQGQRMNWVASVLESQPYLRLSWAKSVQDLLVTQVGDYSLVTNVAIKQLFRGRGNEVGNQPR
jgi:hypothetical protein